MFSWLKGTTTKNPTSETPSSNSSAPISSNSNNNETSKSEEKTSNKQESEASSSSQTQPKSLPYNIQTAVVTNWFSSVGNKIKTLVEEEKNEVKKLLFSEEESAKSTSTPEKPPIVLPWEDIPLEDENVKKEVKNMILNLSKSKRNFMNAPPEDSNFQFQLDPKNIELAQAILKANQDLALARYCLVPKYIKEEPFWRNYFYRIYLIKQAYSILPKPSEFSSNKSSSSKDIKKEQSNSKSEVNANEKKEEEESTQKKKVHEKEDLTNLDLSVANAEMAEWEQEIQAELERGVLSSKQRVEFADDNIEELIKKELEENK